MAIYNNRVCADCGKTFSGGPRARRCPSCRVEHNRMMHTAQARMAKQGKCRHIGQKYKCENCGGEYILTNGKQKYCEKCRPAVYRALDNKQGTEYYHRKYATAEDRARRSAARRVRYNANKAEINAKRRAARAGRSGLQNKEK